MPAQKNCVASVAMNDGTPMRATSTPFRNPTISPEPSPASTATQPSPYSLNSTANTKPENAMIAGKHRSISPAPITKVSPTASRIRGGSVDRNVV